VVLPSLEDPVRLEIFEARRETPAPPADESLLPSWRALRHDYLGERTTMDVLVDCDWLEERLDDEDLVVVDCGVRFEPPVSVTSGRADWSASCIRGSVFLDHFELADSASAVPLAAPAPAQLARALEAVGIRDDTRVVVHDRSDGTWAARLWWMIRTVGHAEVARSRTVGSIRSSTVAPARW
jgi:hypothetical protein